MSRHKPAAEQQEFDFPRSQRKTLIERIVIPPFEFTNSRGNVVRVVRTNTMKHLLKCIESHCGSREDSGCFLKLETIASEIGTLRNQKGELETRTASRAVAACEAADLLKVTRSFYKHAASRYQIDWYTVKQMILDNPTTESLINLAHAREGQGKTTQEHVTHDKLSSTQDKLSSTQDKMSSTHVNLSSPNDVDTSSSRARGFNHGFNHESNHESNHDEVRQFLGYSGWPFRLERNHLQDAFVIQTLWEHALKKGFVRREDRSRFFALAFSATMPDIAKPGGWFTSKLKKAADDPMQWPAATMHAEREAVRAIVKVDATREDLENGRMTQEARKLLEQYQRKIR